MKTLQALNISRESPFMEDLLGRETFAKALTKIVKQKPGNGTIILHGGWGEGKTTFVKMWRKQLLNEGLPCIYINSFENDYCDDPFSMIINAILKYKNKNNLELSIITITKNFFQNGINFFIIQKYAMEILTPYLRDKAWPRIKIVFNNLFRGLFGRAFGESIYSSIELEIASFNSKMPAAKKIDEEKIDLVNNFKGCLSSLSEKLYGNGYPLIIIIDELDRCDPDFSVKALERVKNLISVPNVIIILVVNKEQVKANIQNKYKCTDPDLYLQKFSKIQIRLPEKYKKPQHDPCDIKNFVEKLYDFYDIDKYNPGENSL